jgi:hypothetical protein
MTTVAAVSRPFSVLAAGAWSIPISHWPRAGDQVKVNVAAG